MAAKILIDTSVLVAYFNDEDALHEKAVKLVNRLDDILLTDYIIDEFLNVLTRRKNKHHAIAATRKLLSTSHSLTHIASAEFLMAWNTYQESNKFSFTDCTSLAVMRVFGLKEIATFDKEFEKVEGITVLS